MKINVKKIEYSNHDKRNQIKIPKRLTKELAEFLGIMVGDGHIGKYQNKSGNKKYTHYELGICGNIRDKEYYLNHVNNLFFKLFNTKFNFYFRPRILALVCKTRR